MVLLEVLVVFFFETSLKILCWVCSSDFVLLIFSIVWNKKAQILYFDLVESWGDCISACLMA